MLPNVYDKEAAKIALRTTSQVKALSKTPERYDALCALVLEAVTLMKDYGWTVTNDGKSGWMVGKPASKLYPMDGKIIAEVGGSVLAVEFPVIYDATEDHLYSSDGKGDALEVVVRHLVKIFPHP